MDYAKIVQLVKAGFTAEQIEILAPMFTAPEQAAAPATSPESSPAPAPEPAPAPAPEPAPAPAPEHAAAKETPDMAAMFGQLLEGINGLKSAMQTSAINNSQLPTPQTQTAEQILAELLAPNNK